MICSKCGAKGLPTPLCHHCDTTPTLAEIEVKAGEMGWEFEESSNRFLLEHGNKMEPQKFIYLRFPKDAINRRRAWRLLTEGEADG